jgi:hypothetical protein
MFTMSAKLFFLKKYIKKLRHERYKLFLIKKKEKMAFLNSYKSYTNELPFELFPLKLSDLYDHVGIILNLDDVPGLEMLSLSTSKMANESETSQKARFLFILCFEKKIKTILMNKYVIVYESFFGLFFERTKL